MKTFVRRIRMTWWSTMKEVKQELPDKVTLHNMEDVGMSVLDMVSGYMEEMKLALTTCYIVLIHPTNIGEEPRIVHVNFDRSKAHQVVHEIKKSLKAQGKLNYVSCTKHNIKGL